MVGRQQNSQLRKKRCQRMRRGVRKRKNQTACTRSSSKKSETHSVSDDVFVVLSDIDDTENLNEQPDCELSYIITDVLTDEHSNELCDLALKSDGNEPLHNTSVFSSGDNVLTASTHTNENKIDGRKTNEVSTSTVTNMEILDVTVSDHNPPVREKFPTFQSKGKNEIEKYSSSQVTPNSSMKSASTLCSTINPDLVGEDSNKLITTKRAEIIMMTNFENSCEQNSIERKSLVLDNETSNMIKWKENKDKFNLGICYAELPTNLGFSKDSSKVKLDGKDVNKRKEKWKDEVLAKSVDENPDDMKIISEIDTKGESDNMTTDDEIVQEHVEADDEEDIKQLDEDLEKLIGKDWQVVDFDDSNEEALEVTDLQSKEKPNWKEYKETKFSGLFHGNSHMAEDLKKIKSPFIGVEYVIELWQSRWEKFQHFECILCNKALTRKNLVEHLISPIHRTLYLEKHLPKYGEKFPVTNPKNWDSRFIKGLEDLCEQLEKFHGRQKFHITTYKYFLKHKSDIQYAIQEGPHFSENEKILLPADLPSSGRIWLRRGFSKFPVSSQKIKSLDSARPIEKKGDSKYVSDKTKRFSDNKLRSFSKNSRALSSSKSQNIRESRSMTSSGRNKRECRSKSNSNLNGSEDKAKSLTLNDNAKETNSSGSEHFKRKVNQTQSKHNLDVCHKTQKLFGHNKGVSSSKKKEQDGNPKLINNCGIEQKYNGEDISRIDKNSCKVLNIKTNHVNVEIENIKTAKAKEKCLPSDITMQTHRMEGTSDSKDNHDSAIENESSKIEEHRRKIILGKESISIEKNSRKPVKDNIYEDMCEEYKEKNEHFKNSALSDRDLQNVTINEKDFGSNTNHQRLVHQNDSKRDGYHQKSKDNFQKDKDPPKKMTKDTSQTDQKHQKGKNRMSFRIEDENKGDSLSDRAHQEKKKYDVFKSERNNQNKKSKDSTLGDRKSEKGYKNDFQDDRDWQKEKSKDSYQSDKEQATGEIKDTLQNEKSYKNKKHKDDSQSNNVLECEKCWSNSEKDLNVKNRNALQNFKEHEKKNRNRIQSSKDCYKDDKSKDNCKNKGDQQKEKNKDVIQSDKDHQCKNNPDASQSDRNHQNKKKTDNFQSEKEPKIKNKEKSQSDRDQQKQRSRDSFQHYTNYHTSNNSMGSKEPIKEMCKKDLQNTRNQHKEKSKEYAEHETNKKCIASKDAFLSNKDKERENIYSHNDKECNTENIKYISHNFQEEKNKDCSQIITDWHNESKRKDNCRSDRDQKKKGYIHLLEKKSKNGCRNERERENGKNSKDSSRSNKNQSEHDEKNLNNRSVKHELGNSRDDSGYNSKHSDIDRSLRYFKPNQATYTSRSSSSQKRKKQDYSSEQLQSSPNRSLSFDGVSSYHAKNERYLRDYRGMQQSSVERNYSEKHCPVRIKRSKSPLTLSKPDERITNCSRIRRQSSSQSNECFSLVSSDDSQSQNNGTKTPDMSMEYNRLDSLWKLEEQEFDTSSYHKNGSSSVKSGREELPCTNPPLSSFKDFFHHSKNEVISDRFEGLNETSFVDKFMETSNGEWRMLPERETIYLNQREEQSEEWRDGHGFRLEKTEDSSLSLWKEELENSINRNIRTSTTPKESTVSTEENWQEFCSKRTNELLKEGIKPDCYDFEGEWMELIKRRRNEDCSFSSFGACSSTEQVADVMTMKSNKNEVLDSSKMISDEENNLCSTDDKNYLCSESLGHQRIVMWQSTDQKKQIFGRKRSIEIDESSVPKKWYVRESHPLPSINDSKPSNPGFSQKNMSNCVSSTLSKLTTFPATGRSEDDLQVELLKAFNQNCLSHNNLSGNIFSEDYKESIANQIASVLTKLGMTNISESVLINVLHQLGYLKGNSTITGADTETKPNKDPSFFSRATSHSRWQRNIPFENDQGTFLVHRIGEVLSNLGIQLSADTMQTQIGEIFPHPPVLSSFDNSLPVSTTVAPSYCTNKPFKSEVPKGVAKRKPKFIPKYKQRQLWKRKGRRNTFVHNNFQKLGTEAFQNDSQAGSLRVGEMKNTKQIPNEKSLFATTFRSSVNQGQITNRINEISRHSEVMDSSEFRENQKNQTQDMVNPFGQERTVLSKSLENKSGHMESSLPGPSTKFDQYSIPLNDDETATQDVYFPQRGNIGNSVSLKNDIPCQPYFNPWMKPDTVESIIGPGNNNFNNMTGHFVQSKETNIQTESGWNSQILLKRGESFSQNKPVSQTTSNTWSMSVRPFQNLGHHFTSQNNQSHQQMAHFSEKLVNPVRMPGPHQITPNFPPPFPSTAQASSTNALHNINYSATSSFMPNIWKKF